MRKLSFFVLSMICFVALFAQPANVVIKGTAANANGKVIQFFRYSDVISMNEVLLATDTIRDGRTFELSAYFNYPALVFLQVENYSQSFYVEPSRTYEVAIPTFPTAQEAPCECPLGAWHWAEGMLNSSCFTVMVSQSFPT